MSSVANDGAKTSQSNTGSSGPPEKVRLQGHLTTPVIIILVMAIVSPIGGYIGPLILGIGLGTGAGFPLTMLIGTLVMLCFCAGYAAMSRRVKETGAFYAYITKGLGRPAGGAGSFIALFNYMVIYCGMAGALGYFAGVFVLQHTGLNIPWWVFTLGATAIIYFFGRRNIDVSAKVLVTLLTIEITLLTIFMVAALIKIGPGAYSLSSFNPSTAFAGGGNAFAVGLMFCIFLYGGVELAAVYAEESKNPEKTVGKATYGAVAVIGIFYVLLSWSVISVVGAANVQEAALSDLGQFGFIIMGQILGPTVQVLLTFLVITSLFAAMIGNHQAASRYMVAMGRDKLMPDRTAYVDPQYKAPQTANLYAVLFYVIFIGAFALAKSDPYLTLYVSLGALTVLNIALLWLTVSLSFIVYFRRHKDPRWIQTCLLPIIALIVFVIMFALIFKNYAMLTGSTIAWINNLPWILIPIAGYGVWRMLYLRTKKPEVYAQIWPDVIDDTEDVDKSGPSDFGPPVAK